MKTIVFLGCSLLAAALSANSTVRHFGVEVAELEEEEDGSLFVWTQPLLYHRISHE